MTAADLHMQLTWLSHLMVYDYTKYQGTNSDVIAELYAIVKSMYVKQLAAEAK